MRDDGFYQIFFVERLMNEVETKKGSLSPMEKGFLLTIAVANLLLPSKIQSGCPSPEGENNSNNKRYFDFEFS